VPDPPSVSALPPSSIQPAIVAPAKAVSPRAVASSSPALSNALPAPAPLAPAPSSEPKVDAPHLFNRANAARRSGAHDQALLLYDELTHEYPASREATEACASAGRMLLADGDARDALPWFDRYLVVSGPLEEDVMFDRARALGDLGRSDDEGRAWSNLLRAYPDSVHAPHAHARLRELTTQTL
jgi:tetratricopeptide (TPR) repeat protein